MPSKSKSKPKSKPAGKKDSSKPDEHSMSIEELVEYFKPESGSSQTHNPKISLTPMEQQSNRLPGNLTTDAPPPKPKPKPKSKPKKKQK